MVPRPLRPFRQLTPPRVEARSAPSASLGSSVRPLTSGRRAGRARMVVTELTWNLDLDHKKTCGWVMVPGALVPPCSDKELTRR